MSSRAPFLLFGALALAPQISAQTWDAIGPYGGDVRALAADPARPASSGSEPPTVGCSIQTTRAARGNS